MKIPHRLQQQHHQLDILISLHLASLYIPYSLLNPIWSAVTPMRWKRDVVDVNWTVRFYIEFHVCMLHAFAQGEDPKPGEQFWFALPGAVRACDAPWPLTTGESFLHIERFRIKCIAGQLFTATLRSSGRPALLLYLLKCKH